MSEEHVRYEVAEGIATITLNRPDRLNAVSRSMILTLVDLFDRTDADDDVRAVIITGEGRAFCSGADLSSGGDTFDFAAGERTPLEEGRDAGGLFTLRVYRSIKPVIAAINGAAVGFGASLTLPADVRVAADDAKFGFVFGARGIVPDAGSSWFLPKIVGLPRALEWCLSGRIFTADEALDAGLVNSIHPRAELLDRARDIARGFAQNVAPVSAALTRQLLWQMAGEPHPIAAHRVESRAITFTGRADDAAEGVRAFLEKRAPTWSMRPSVDLPTWFPFRDEPPFTG